MLNALCRKSLRLTEIVFNTEPHKCCNIGVKFDVKKYTCFTDGYLSLTNRSREFKKK